MKRIFKFIHFFLNLLTASMAPGVVVKHIFDEPHLSTQFHKNGGIVNQNGQTSSLFSPEWPTHLESSLVWKGSQFNDESTYTYTLMQDEIIEIESAMESFKRLGLDGHKVSRINFLLPTLGKRLDSLALELHQGRGFFALRGLKPGNYTPEDNILIFLGVSSYVAAMRGKQNDDGHMLAHIMNAKSRVPQMNRPVRDSNLPSYFHTDMFCNILAMQTRDLAVNGGNHILASAWNIYNTLAATRPDILYVLSRPDWPFDHGSQSQLFETNKRGLFHFHGGRIILNFTREPLLGIEGMKRTSGFEMTDEQHKALNAVQEIATTHQLTLAMQPGDLTFVNNFAILHAREAFEDSLTQSRYLVRLWLKNSELAWKLPYSLKSGNERIFGNDDLIERWNVQYTPRMRFKIAERLTP